MIFRLIMHKNEKKIPFFHIKFAFVIVIVIILIFEFL